MDEYEIKLRIVMAVSIIILAVAIPFLINFINRRKRKNEVKVETVIVLNDGEFYRAAEDPDFVTEEKTFEWSTNTKKIILAIGIVAAGVVVYHMFRNRGGRK